MCGIICGSNSGLLYDYYLMSNLSLKIVKLLTKKKLTVSFAESCTGGLLASSITSISGSSKVFNIGLVTYSNNAKVKLLQVPKKTITKYGAVSYETCLSMVKNLSKISKANISISITGVAGPNGGTKAKPVGLVYICILKKGEVGKIKKYIFRGDRQSVRYQTVMKALDSLTQLV